MPGSCKDHAVHCGQPCTRTPMPTPANLASVLSQLQCRSHPRPQLREGARLVSPLPQPWVPPAVTMEASESDSDVSSEQPIGRYFCHRSFSMLICRQAASINEGCMHTRQAGCLQGGACALEALRLTTRMTAHAHAAACRGLLLLLERRWGAHQPCLQSPPAEAPM